MHASTVGSRSPEAVERDQLLTEQAAAFLEALHEEFDPTRKSLLQNRAERRTALSRGLLPDKMPATERIRHGSWQVASCPTDLETRNVEITGPVDRKMMINALNSGADCFMADFEDSLSPTWPNIIEGQRNLRDAVTGTLSFDDPGRERRYRLNDRTATLLVRPRGWHLTERNHTVRGEPISASLFDMGLFLYHNAQELLDKGSAPYFYLPKLESHLEARLWNEVFSFAESYLGIPSGTIRATVLIETIWAAFEMEEILYEFRDYASGLNAGRWDYIFSIIKAFDSRSDFVLPDRDQVTMTVPFMQAYTEHLVEVCHKRGAHAIGGMSAFIPSRNQEVNERALEAVKEDKRREAKQGFDGTWVAHPGLVEVASNEFDAVLAGRPHQKEKRPDRATVDAQALREIAVPGGEITEAGVRKNIRVSLQYINAWLCGTGGVAIDNLMEDAATAEISRAQLWQWVHHEVALADGTAMTLDHYCRLREQELVKLEGERLHEAAQLLDDMVEALAFPDFFTLKAYTWL